MADEVVRLNKVRRDYLVGDQITTALGGVDLVIERGEFVAIVGPSGSGKSTMMNLIGCLDRPSSGSVLIAGDSTNDLSDNKLTELRSRAIGFVFQQYHSHRKCNGTSALPGIKH
jgi:putative ABC transport system ATP-binding protein